MENEHLDSGDQPTPLTQPPKELPDNLLRHIFHCLPTDPSALAFVSMAQKDWRRLVNDEENFSCNGAAVYWMTEVDRTVAEFQLETQRLLLIDTPEVIRGHNFFVAPAKDARLRLAGIIDNSVMLYSLDEGTWDSRTLVRLEDFLPFHAYGQQENVAQYPDDEDEEELLDTTVKPHLIGFSEQLDCIFLEAEPGVFMISLESGQHEQVLEPGHRFFGPVYPYSAFYTPERRGPTGVTSRDNVAV